MATFPSNEAPPDSVIFPHEGDFPIGRDPLGPDLSSGRRHLTAKAPLLENRSPKDFSTTALGKTNGIAIFSFEEFQHENHFKPLSPAQIRRLERCA
jgi:hypothetical protein